MKGIALLLIFLIVLVIFVSPIQAKEKHHPLDYVIMGIKDFEDFSGMISGTDLAYVWLGYGGEVTTTHHYKYALYYAVFDLDGGRLDDERITFSTRWYYGLLTGQSLNVPSTFSEPMIYAFFPTNNHHAWDEHVHLGPPSPHIYFWTRSPYGWNVERRYMDDNLGSGALLIQESGRIIGKNYYFLSGAQFVVTDSNRVIDGDVFGIRVKISISVEQAGEKGGAKEWDMAAGLLRQ